MSESLAPRKIDGQGIVQAIRAATLKHRASLGEKERKALEAREKRTAAEILITTSTGNEIKPGK